MQPMLLNNLSNNLSSRTNRFIPFLVQEIKDFLRTFKDPIILTFQGFHAIVKYLFLLFSVATILPVTLIVTLACAS